MGGEIFISYRREESGWVAGRLRDRLQRDFDPEKIFMDIDAKAIPLGANFKQVIERKVCDCDVLIAVIGKNWLSTTDDSGGRRLHNPEDFVRLEIGTALKREICVIPVLVDGVRMPRSMDLPEDLRSLIWLNALSVTAGTYFDVDCQRLAAAISQILEQLAAKEQERSAAEQRQREEAEARRREEKERLEAEQREKERLEKESLEAEQREKERLEAERLEKKRLEAEQREKELLEAELREKEHLDAEQQEKERLKAEQQEKERLEALRQEKQLLEAEQRVEAERLEKERLEAEQREKEKARETERKQQPSDMVDVLFQWVSRCYFVLAISGYLLATVLLFSNPRFNIVILSLVSLPNFIGLMNHRSWRCWTIFETIAYWIGAAVYGLVVVGGVAELGTYPKPTFPMIIAFSLQLLIAAIATICLRRQRSKVG
jgi:hypothetical protein